MWAFFRAIVFSFTYALLGLLMLGALFLLTSPTGIDRLSEMGTLITALATVVLAIVTMLLWTVSASASEASRRSADAATMSNKILEVTAERQLRAYVIANAANLYNDSGGHVNNHIAANAYAFFVIQFENAGQTPATNLRVRSQFVLRPVGEEVGDGFDLGDAQAQSATTLGAKVSASTICRSETPISATEYSNVRSGRLSAVCFGEITYTDVFGRERVSRFAYHNAGGIYDGSCNYLPEGNTMA